MKMVSTEIQPFVISRTFNISRELMWSLWTNVEHLAKWFGPKGVTASHATLDLRPGGTFHYMMTWQNGMEYWGRMVFQEIVPPEKLVWINSFSDPEGGITRHPLTTDPWPLELHTEVTFTEHEGKTTITIRWVPINATDNEIEFFNTAHSSMRQGWTGTFENLEHYFTAIC